MKMFTLLILLALSCPAVSVLGTETAVLYTRTTPPHDWTLSGPTLGHESVEFMIALKQRNRDLLEKIFWQVSDPQHENYQNFMTPSEITSMIAPEHETTDTVKYWLKEHGCNNIKDYGDALEVHTRVDIASKLFSTTFHFFTHDDGAVVVRQWGSYSIPTEISQHVDMITGLSTFPVPHLKVQKSGSRSPSLVNGYGVVAQTVYEMYGVRSQTPGAASNVTSQGVIEFHDQNFAPADLSNYAKQCNITAQAVPPENIIGPNDPTYPQVEAELDIQLIATVNTEANNWFWIEDGNSWLYSFAVHFFGTANVPQVISISYCWWEGGQCDSVANPVECSQLGVNSQAYVARVNTELLKIGLRGITILVASGDSGANGRTNEDCSVPQLRPDFPASSPYVTAVGGTQLDNPVYNLSSPPMICSSSGYACPSGGQEVAVSYDVAEFTSGGGFSNFTARPSYQTAAVNAYLASGVTLPPYSYFNVSGRAFPDVAAIGYNTLMYLRQVFPNSGTSASTPIFAGLVALLTEIAIAKSGKPLGFINPLLYQAYANAPNVFNDITVGDNKCTEQGCSSSCQGFFAISGWDPVTGLGSLNYEKFAAYLSDHFDQINANHAAAAAAAAQKHSDHEKH